MTRPRGFAEWSPSPEKLELVEHVKGVLNEYSAYLPLTLRQVFYRLVGTRGYDKTERAYKRLGETLNRARRARLIAFRAIRDDGVRIEQPYCNADLEDAKAGLVHLADGYRRDRQEGQEVRLMVMCEAAGMVPQLARVCDPYGIPVQSSGGFDSTTAKFELARRISEDGPTLILHIGDHDPSGVHVYQSLADDVERFVSQLDGAVYFRRHAVTEEQIEALDLPTAPAKATDNRSFNGVGDDPDATVQAEAIPPDALAEGLKAAIEDHMDMAAYAAMIEVEEEERGQLVEAVSQLNL